MGQPRVAGTSAQVSMWGDELIAPAAAGSSIANNQAENTQAAARPPRRTNYSVRDATQKSEASNGFSLPAITLPSLSSSNRNPT